MEPMIEDCNECVDEYGELDKLIKGYWMVINLLEVEQPKQESVIKFLRKRLDKMRRQLDKIGMRRDNKDGE